MVDDSRSPGVCHWDPGDACKVGLGACLPPRKRLLAGLKQNGWLSSSASHLQSCDGAGSMEEVKLEVDLAEINNEDNGDACLVEPVAGKQGECSAVESSVSVKSKKASRRRKSLSVLADCHNKLQPEVPKSGLVCKNEKQSIATKASLETVFTSTGENEAGPSYKERVDAARAAAAVAAKAAAEARAIALDKAAAAAKAAAVAKAALESLALAAYDEGDWGIQSSKHIRGFREKRKKGDKPRQELKHDSSPFRLPHTEGVKIAMRKEKRRLVCSVPLNKGKEEEQTQNPHVVLSRVDMGACMRNSKRSEAPQSLLVNYAHAPSDKNEEDDQAHFSHVYTAACPLPAPLDDEKLARQLHRAMNSSPRISRYQAPFDCSKKLETPGCIQNKYLRAGGCNLSWEKKPIKREKKKMVRTSIGRADVKVKSMSAINETLNMLQGTSPSQFRVLRGMISCSASSEEHTDNVCVKKDLLPAISGRAFASWSKCNEKGDKSTLNGDGNSSSGVDEEERSKSKSCKSYPYELGVTGTDDPVRAIKWAETIKKQKLSSKLRTGGSLIAASGGKIQSTLLKKGSKEMLAKSADNPSATFYTAESEPTLLHGDTAKDCGLVGRNENEGKQNVPRLGAAPQVAGDVVIEMSSVIDTQENSYCDKPSGVARRSRQMSSHGERHAQRQKVLGVLSNGLAKGNQSNFGGSMKLSSPTVS